ncbi:MAG TPA: SAM-dependent methyltransferase, partial [Caulobacteraceae bacterium]|nr:SAM-dependent methyltransferase [Caulobacteraceae bacterium]
MSLKDRLRAEIAESGPIGVDVFMARCLHDPLDGYYATRPAIGEAGDFITAPMVSQMFGELIGLWLAQTWMDAGAPPRALLVEAGPGDGTLMSDILRAAGIAPGFLASCELWLIETSPPLRARQAKRLASAGPRWASSLAELSADAPIFLVANEFLDCLPTRQFQRTERGWAERVVGLGRGGDLAFGLRPAGGRIPDAPIGAVIERSSAQTAFVAELAGRIARQGGVALLIDYGAADASPGDTLQALVGHRKVDPLANPGETDLTVHADFAAVLEVAHEAGARAALSTQSELLRRLGIEARAERLAAA